jgi:hypothetical protein
MDQQQEILFELVEKHHLSYYNPTRIDLPLKNNQNVGTISKANPTITANTIPTRVYPAPN